MMTMMMPPPPPPPPRDQYEYTEAGIQESSFTANMGNRRRRGNPLHPSSSFSAAAAAAASSTSITASDVDANNFSGPLRGATCLSRREWDESEQADAGRVQTPAVKPPSSSPSPSTRPRSFNDASNPNAALHRALLAIKKQQQQRMPATDADVLPLADHGRSITNPDARTLSMRERGRWGNSKMQQHMMFSSYSGDGSSSTSCEGKQQACDGVRVSTDGGGPNSEDRTRVESSGTTSCGQYHKRPHLQHVQCLHCGSFSTTPVTGGHTTAAKNVGSGTNIKVGSHSFGRRGATVVRDYSWQQELQEKMVKSDPPAMPQPQPWQKSEAEAADQFKFHRQHHHQSSEKGEYSRCPDNHFPMGGSGPLSAGGHLSFGHHPNPWTWQGRYMLLCQAIAAGAFMDEEMSSMLASGYSCAACEWGGCRSFRQANGSGATDGGFRTTATSERMMELEAFSGPLGYVSESKVKGGAMNPHHNASKYYNGTASSSSSNGNNNAGAAGETVRRRRSGKWWSRISSSFVRSSSSSSSSNNKGVDNSDATPRSTSTAQCAGCRQRLWVHDDLSHAAAAAAAAAKRLCPDCLISSPASGPMGYNSHQPSSSSSSSSRATHQQHQYQHRRRGPPPMKFAYKAAAAAAAASASSRPCPRRWRLMKLCRYLLGL